MRSGQKSQVIGSMPLCPGRVYLLSLLPSLLPHPCALSRFPLPCQSTVELPDYGLKYEPKHTSPSLGFSCWAFCLSDEQSDYDSYCVPVTGKLTDKTLENGMSVY